MSALLVTEELAQALIGAFVAVCRADGDLNVAEIRAIEAVCAELFGAGCVSNESLLLSDVTPESLGAAAVRGEGPYRAGDVGTSQSLAARFVPAAIRVARADGDLNEPEAAAIYRFATRLGMGVESLELGEQALRFYAPLDPPESVPRLRRLLAACRRTRDWNGVLASLQRLVEIERRPLRRGRYLAAMAAVCRDRLAAPDRAVALFSAALAEDPFAGAPLDHAKHLLVGLGRENEADALEAHVLRHRRRLARGTLSVAASDPTPSSKD
jgi:tellurite resistance protein